MGNLFFRYLIKTNRGVFKVTECTIFDIMVSDSDRHIDMLYISLHVVSFERESNISATVKACPILRIDIIMFLEKTEPKISRLPIANCPLLGNVDTAALYSNTKCNSMDFE